MVIFDWKNESPAARDAILARPQEVTPPATVRRVADIFDQVKNDGDQALRALTSELDRVSITSIALDVSAFPEPAVTAADFKALIRAVNNIREFHRAQMPDPVRVETQTGVICERIWRPLDTVGLYIPGGSASLVSTLLMLVIPAMIAGVRNLVICTPPQRDVLISHPILAVARWLGIEKLYLVGGAQAVAAMAYGTETIARVDKIFGPGNVWVTEAKRHASGLPGGPAIDMPAGPSEVMIVADDQADAGVVASDLLAQAEHDPLAQAVLVAFSTQKIDQVQIEIEQQLVDLPRRDIAKQSMAGARFILIEDRAAALEVINKYAPEHLILNLDSAESLLPGVQNAGSVFLGPLTPESVGDYASGTNHVLPTSGFARSYSGLTTEAFMKSLTVQTLNREGLTTLGPVVERLARLEGLEAHARSITRRLQMICAGDQS